MEFGGNNIIYYRTVGDYRRLRELANKAQRFAVLGGGFIGSEIAAALRMNHKEVIMLHEDNANTMGHWAGRNMAATPQRYEHLPFFYSDLFELGYEAVGELDARLATGADWKEPFREGVVYYHRDGQIRGVLLWNVWGQVEAARQLISGRRQFQPQDLRQDLLKAA